MNKEQRKLITGRGAEQAQQDAGLRVQLASHPLQDRRSKKLATRTTCPVPGTTGTTPRLLCTEGPLPVPERHGRHDAKTCQHKPARLGADHGSRHQRQEVPLVPLA